MKNKQRKRSLTQARFSNNHTGKLSRKDIVKINNTFTEQSMKMEELELHQLQKIVDDKFVHEGKKLTGSYRRAVEHIIETKKEKLKNEKEKQQPAK